MRLYEFTTLLLEYKRDITQVKLGDKLVQAAERDENQDIDTILSSLEQIDPTKHKQYVEWLARQYIAGQFRLEDINRINDVLVKFENAKRRMQQRDINKFTFRSLEDEMDKIYNVELEKDETDTADTTGTFPVVPNSKVLYNGPLGQLAIPETAAASCKLGKGTKWCTAATKDNNFDVYSKPGDPLYVWRDKSGDKYQFHFGKTQFMDARDKPINGETLTYFRTKHPVLSKLFKKAEAAIVSDPSVAYNYARYVIKGRWPEAEKAIVSDPFTAFNYALDVIKGRWLGAEKAIASNPDVAYNYARYVIKGRWPEAEKAIVSDPSTTFNYACYVIKGRWPEAEKAIVSDSSTAYNYARYVIKGRWPEAEKAIASNPSAAYNYARYVIKGRFPEAEKAIASNPDVAYNYARYVIKGRFPEAEKAIASDPGMAKKYKMFLKTLNK